ncbi:unnamed protein product [Somion occarium]
MLSNNTLATPRPRPPAKVRRSPSLNFPPPPPYAPRMDMLLDSPITVTAQLVNSPETEAPGSTPNIEEWMNEKSRGELSDLLLKAGGLIKSRETELGLTSALCKTLYHDNISLKTRHEALIARLPPHSAASPGASSPVSSHLPSPSPLHSPHYYSDSLPLTPVGSPPPSTSSLSFAHHSRRVSVTPGEIAHLADQNAELLDKLQKLEEESEKADQAGKRRLRKLEKEIQILKDELENTQARGIELEQKAKVALELTDDEVQKRKEEREERLRNLRENSLPLSDSLSEVKDFAPAPELPRSSTLKTIPELPSAPPTLNLTTKSTLFVLEEDKSPAPSSASSSSSSYFPPSRPHSSPQLEYALISQLLSKIRELEEANSQIKNEQAATSERLRTAQRESESIRRAYACLAEEAGELRVIVEETPVLQAAVALGTGDTVKFSSLRKTIEGDIGRLFDKDSDDEFASGISTEMQSTHRSVLVPQPNMPVFSHRPRKSVVGLFDDEGGPVQGSSSEPDYPPSLKVSSAFRTPSPLPGELGDISVWSTAATEGVSFASPVSPTHALSSTYPAGSLGTKQTLGSELGSEFGDDWGENAGNHHLRASSLYNLAGMMASREGSPIASPIGSPLAKPALELPTVPAGTASDSVWEDLDEPPAPSITGSVTPTRKKGKGLELVIDPPTPQLSSLADNPSPSIPGSLRDLRSSRNYRLSQTVRGRTNRWIEGRYTDSPQSIARRRKPTRPSHANRASDASMIFSETFDTVVRQLSFNGAVTEDDERIYIEGDDADETVREAHAPSAEKSVVLPPPKKDGFVGFILEVWLWLQFAIIVLVFLWAMARRGPKSILHEAETRRRQGTVTKR